MIVSLPMYDRSETAGANDRFWSLIRDHPEIAALSPPERLNRDGDLWDHWENPDLLLSQTCGLPYRARLHGKIALVGTPVYDVPDLPPGHYRSVFVVRREDGDAPLNAFAGRCLAYNEADSQSGWGAPQNHAAALGFRFTDTLATGGHRYSAEAVATGRADIAAIDILTWKMICRWDSAATALTVIAQTEATPALPWITARTELAEVLHEAIAAAIAGLAPEDREQIGLKGMVRIPPEDYLAVPTPPPPGQVD